jgi:acylphosphatase
MSEKAVRVVVTGRVQGVGYRAWLSDEAEMRGLIGWVRNRRDGGVEAVLCGPEATVTEMVALCRDGPRAALVFDVATEPHDGAPLAGFRVLPTE